MADLYRVKSAPEVTPALGPNARKKAERDAKLLKEKLAAIEAKQAAAAQREKEIIARSLAYADEYDALVKQQVSARKEAEAAGGFYRAPDAKIAFVVRIKGINKIAPKPRKVLQLFRLNQLHNGVFIRLNKATLNMLQLITPYVTFGYPSQAVIRKLILKRGYARIGPQGAKQRVRITDNEMIHDNLGALGISSVDDIVHELFTCGPHFKEVSNFLWPFKLSSPRLGFVAKRHGYCETRKGDSGNRESHINELLMRML